MADQSGAGIVEALVEIVADIGVLHFAKSLTCPGRVVGYPCHSDMEGNGYLVERRIQARAAVVPQYSSSLRYQACEGLIVLMRDFGTCEWTAVVQRILRNAIGCKCLTDDLQASYRSIAQLSKAFDASRAECHACSSSRHTSSPIWVLACRCFRRALESAVLSE